MAKHVAVIGAGAFGGWTALWLRRKGAQVTLLDAWGPGNSRASSGDETRVIRAVYGSDRIYVDQVARSLPIWKESGERWGQKLYHPTGLLWMYSAPDHYVRSSMPLLAEYGLSVTELTLSEAQRRFPLVDFQGVQTVFFEEQVGYLLARRSCQLVAAAFVAEGGEYRQVGVRPGPVSGGGMERLDLSDGTTLSADAYVFACGPWLGRVFPDELGHGGIFATRQEVFYFGTPAGDTRYLEGNFPIWMDMTDENSFYGIPGNESRGFKVANDVHGEPFDPTNGDRTPSPTALAKARAQLARRFPGLKDAPVAESRVCQYENSADGQLLFDRHPGAANTWFLGGGSGHGFKLGPALGQDVAETVLDGGKPPELFSLSPGRVQRMGRSD
ncbi:MAG TPA: FAD-dependent oxidoreductase [Thermoanaerobaculia bacterium]|nr:FAD-dependent oxidoreductase [Thermoanaerobaculia bacterium]